MNNEPKNCQTCNASFETSGYCFTMNGDGKIIKALCRTCSEIEVFDRYKKDGILTTSLIMDNLHTMFYFRDRVKDLPYVYSLVKDIAWCNDYNLLCQVQSLLENYDRLDSQTKIEFGIQKSLLKITKKISEFEKEVWYKGVQKQAYASAKKGFSAKIGNYSVLTYSMCGRSMITFDDDKSTVTSITLDDEVSREGCMGWQGVCATEAQALALIDKAITEYKNGNLVFEDDTKVSLLY